MQRYSYKLLKFSELDGPYRGVSHADDEVEQRVNRQLDSFAEQGWWVKNFSVDYVGGRVIYTVLLEREAESAGSNQTEAKADLPLAKRVEALSRPVPERADVKPRRVFAETAELRPLDLGPTVGERAAEIRQSIETSKGPEYYRKALDVFDASLRARMEQEKIPAEAIALRAVKQPGKQNEPTFQFALCWLSEHGHSDRPLSTILGGGNSGAAQPEDDKTRQLSPQSMQANMASRFDLPDNGVLGAHHLPSRFGR
jgi:hypothetical protein